MQAPQTDLTNLLPCGIFSFEESGIVTYINTYLLERLNYKSVEVVGQSIEKILTLASRIFYQTHFFPLLKLQGKVEEIFINLKGTHSIDLPFLVNAHYAISDNVGTTYCICMPVNERKKYEDEIIQARKTAEEALHKNEELLKIKNELEKEHEELDKKITQLKHKNAELLQLNDVIAHDLQEPVRKISIYTDVAFMNPDIIIDQQTSNALKVIRKSAVRIKSLLGQLQEYMLIGTEGITIKVVNLNEVIDEELNTLKKENSETEATFQVEEMPSIRGNEQQLHFLFRQVLSNCFQFKDSERPLTVSINCSLIQNNQFGSLPDKYKYIDCAKITITDNGIGFEAKYGNHIFKILRKMDKVSKGLGFGLAFCARIVENHGGNISATGEVGKGATFTITLPLK